MSIKIPNEVSKQEAGPTERMIPKTQKCWVKKPRLSQYEHNTQTLGMFFVYVAHM